MKKVLSFVLVLSLVLSSFSMAFAGEVKTGLTDVEGTANEAAIKVVNDLGIVTGYTDGTFKADKAVNRAEFAVMLTKALAIPESALAGYTATSFTDVEGYEWAVPYLAFCESKGIMSGYGNGLVKPGNTITVNEAMTMALRAIGLTPNSAWLVGTWPANYVTVAQNNDLYENVAAVATVDRGSAAQIIYNTLLVPGFSVNADGDTAQDQPRMISALNCTVREQFVRYDEDALVPTAELVGAWADVYYTLDDNGRLEDIIAIDPISEFITGEFNGDGEFETEDVTYSVAATTSIAAVVNGQLTEDVYADEDALKLYAGTNEVTLAVEIVGKTITEIYSEVDWVLTNGSADQAPEDVQEIIADDQTLLDKAFYTDKSNEIIEDSYVLVGAKSIYDIEEDDVVYVYTYGNVAANKIVKIAVGTKTVEGKITKTYTDSDSDYHVVIDGNDYVTAGFKALTSLEASDEVSLVLDAAGDVYDFELIDATADNFAVVTDTVQQIGRDYTVVVLDKAGTEKEYTLDLSTTARTSLSAVNVGEIITFALNSDGELDEFTTPANVTAQTAKLNANGSLFGNVKVAKNVVVFVEDGSDYSLGKIENIVKDENITVDYVLEDGEIVAMVVAEAAMGNANAIYGIVTDNSATVLNADGDKVPGLDVIVAGEKEARVDVVTELTFASAAALDTTSTTGIYEISFDADGVITKVETPSIVSVAAVGTVAAIDGKIITMSDDTTSYELASDVILFVWDDEEGEWTVKTTLTSLKKLTVKLYDTDEDTSNGYEIVIAR